MKTLVVVLSLWIGSVAVPAQPAFSQDLSSQWQAPASAASRKNPLAGKPQLAAGGAKVFERNCSVCHGDAAGREAHKAPDLASAATQAQSDGALFWKITNGNLRTGMPGWSNIPEPQRWQLILYIRSLK
ncbi:MAG TPA: cytochrome c [Terriglobales bacterium]|nr:cytochrome c [Terriglobales bacterium]